MRLYLVRHGDALSSSEDPGCPLSPEGREEVKKVARLLGRMKVRVGRIECSTKQRAMETAEILSRSVGAKDQVFPREGLKPGDGLGPVLQDLRGVSEDRMLVGHLPYMEYMASTLLTGSSSRLRIRFGTATVACLQGGGRHPWELLWMVTPETA